jgi:hypothetical protein
MTRWSCPAPDSSKEWDTCQRFVSHLHATSCKTVLSDEVALAPFMTAASRWLCLACSRTWHSRTPVCIDCGLAPPTLWPCPFLPSHRLQCLRPVFSLSLRFFAPESQHLSTCTKQHAARWPRRGRSLLRLLRASRLADMGAPAFAILTWPIYSMRLRPRPRP